eukprot:1138672-Pelagomonas_calceolata.AAC.1
MLYADDLCPTSNQPDQLQLMLYRLHVYAQQKGLVINAAKSEIVYSNSRGDYVPVFTLGGACLMRADSFRYLDMLFTKQHFFQATEHICVPFLANCRRIRQFASEYHLTDRPYTMLWLTKAYAHPATSSMCACQIWGTRFIKEGVEMDCPANCAPVLTEAYPWGKAYHSQLVCAAGMWS